MSIRKRQKTGEEGSTSLLSNLLQQGNDLNEEVSSLRRDAEAQERKARQAASQKLMGMNINEFVSKALENARQALLNGKGEKNKDASAEIEARLGLVCTSGSAVGESDAPRRAVPSKRGCGAVQTQSSDTFVSGVSEVMAREVSETVTKLAEQVSQQVPLANHDHRNGGPSTKGKQWRSVESTFSSEERSMRDLRLVVSPERGSFYERKARIAVFEAALPSASYDFRIGASFEKTLTAIPSELHAIANGKVWHTHRLKQRVSTALKFWRIDETIVTTNSYLGLTTDQAIELSTALNNGNSEKNTTNTAHQSSSSSAFEKGTDFTALEQTTAKETVTTYEVEIELLPHYAQKWLLGQYENDAGLIEELSKILAALNPADILDTRRDPSVQAPPEVITKALDRLRSSVSNLNAKTGGHIRKFPGTMPVGFCRRHIRQSQTASAYAVAEKSDGERRLLVIIESTALPSDKMAVLIDRSLEVKVVRLTAEALSTLPIGVVLDGEIVLNLEQQVSVFLIFDVLHDGMRELTGESFDRRYFTTLSHLTGRLAGALCAKCPSTVDDEVQILDDTFIQQAMRYTAQTKSEQSSNTQEASEKKDLLYGTDTLFLVPKRFCRPRDLKRRVLSKIRHEINLGNSRVFREDPARCHRSDGLIFAPRKSAYQAGSDPKLFKWKWPEGLTVDLVVGGAASRGGELGLAAAGDDGDLIDCSRHIVLSEHDKARLRADLAFFAKSSDSGGVVVELGLDSATGYWNYHNPRPDKSTPNHIDVFISTLLLHAESPDQPEMEYRLKITDPTKDDWNKVLAATLNRTTTPWREHFSKTNSRAYWWNKETGLTTWERPPELALGI